MLLRWMTALLLLGGMLLHAVARAEPIQDLRDWTPEGDLRTLDGFWSLRWLEPHRVATEVQLPFAWKDGTPRLWGEVGFGQVELITELRLPSASAPLGLMLDGVASAAAVWVNEQLVYVRGQPGAAGMERADLRPAIIPLPPGYTRLDVRILLSNHFLARGGILRPLRIGEMATLEQHVYHHHLVALGGLGALLMLAVLLLLPVWRQSGPMLLPGLQALGWALWVAADSGLLTSLGLGPATVLRLGHLLPCLLPLLLQQQQGGVALPAPRLLIGLTTALALPMLLAPTALVSLLGPVVQSWLAVGILLGIVVAIQTMRRGATAWQAGLPGLLLLALAMLLDRLHGEVLALVPAAILQQMLHLLRVTQVSEGSAVIPPVEARGPEAHGLPPASEPALPAGLQVLMIGTGSGDDRLTAERLTAWGCQLTRTAEASEVRRLCALREFDLVLLGDCDVAAMCRLVLEETGEWAPPLVALGGTTSPRVEGLLAWLPRPLSRQALARLLEAPAPADAPSQSSSTRRLQALRDWLGEDLYHQLLPSLVVSLREVEEALCQLDPADQEECSRLCHRLRGSALNFGLDELAAACVGVRQPAQLVALRQLLATQLRELEQGLGKLQTKGDCSDLPAC